MASSRKNITQATAAVPTAPKRKGKAIEAPEPAVRQTNPSAVHIHDEEDSHSSSATPRGRWLLNPNPSTSAINSTRCSSS